MNSFDKERRLIWQLQPFGLVKMRRLVETVAGFNRTVAAACPFRLTLPVIRKKWILMLCQPRRSYDGETHYISIQHFIVSNNLK